MSTGQTDKILASLDIDWTQFIPEDRTTDTDAGSFRLRDQLNALRKADRAFVVHNTGIPLHRVFDRMTGMTPEYPRAVIASADAVISDVGTEITLPPFTKVNGVVQGTPLSEWQDRLKQICPPELMDDVKAFIGGLPSTVLKQEAVVSPFKVTAIVENPDSHSEVIQDVSQQIAERYAGVLQVTFWSRNGFDITPTASGKGPALSFLHQMWGVKAENVIVGGDSMNDLSMFAENHSFKGIIPGNAMQELVQELSRMNRRNMYLAPQDKAGPYGILQGLEYFDVIPKSSHDPQYAVEIAAANGFRKGGPQPT